MPRSSASTTQMHATSSMCQPPRNRQAHPHEPSNCGKHRPAHCHVCVGGCPSWYCTSISGIHVCSTPLCAAHHCIDPLFGIVVPLQAGLAEGGFLHLRCTENRNAGFAWRAAQNGFADCYLHVHLPGGGMETVRVTGAQRVSKVLQALQKKHMPDNPHGLRCASALGLPQYTASRWLTAAARLCCGQRCLGHCCVFFTVPHAFMPHVYIVLQRHIQAAIEHACHTVH